MENLKRIREKKGLGVNELGRLSGVNASYISHLENGRKSNPSMSTLEKIADALEVPLDYLLKKSPKAIIEDKLEELNITLKDLADKTNLTVGYLNNLDNITPDEKDYENMKRIGEILGINLADALDRQEPPIIERWDKANQVREGETLYGMGKFDTPEAAMKFILKQPAIMGFGGFDTSKMSEDEIVEFANELLNQLKLISYKYK